MRKAWPVRVPQAAAAPLSLASTPRTSRAWTSSGSLLWQNLHSQHEQKVCRYTRLPRLCWMHASSAICQESVAAFPISRGGRGGQADPNQPPASTAGGTLNVATAEASLQRPLRDESRPLCWWFMHGYVCLVLRCYTLSVLLSVLLRSTRDKKRNDIEMLLRRAGIHSTQCKPPKRGSISTACP